jgi:hypothetical protein
LGNRIKSLVSTLRKDPQGRVLWKRDEWCNCTFGDLFTNQLDVATIEPGMQASGTGWRLSVLPTDTEVPFGFSTHVDNHEHGGRCIDHEYQRIPPSMRAKYLEAFARLEIQPAILERVAQFERENLLERKVVAVHLRTWKVDPYPGIRADRTTKFLEYLQSYPDETYFLLSADCDEALSQFKDAFPGRVLAYPRTVSRSQGRKSSQGQIEDFEELMALSRTSELIASYRSTFSELIWWL